MWREKLKCKTEMFREILLYGTMQGMCIKKRAVGDVITLCKELLFACGYFEYHHNVPGYPFPKILKILGCSVLPRSLFNKNARTNVFP